MYSYLLGSNRLLASLVELFNGLLVITQILLTTDENDRKTTAEMEYFRDPLHLSTCQRFLILKGGFEQDPEDSYLLLNVIERVGGVDSEANQDNVRVWV